MRLLEDPSAVVHKSISWTKENNGTGARQQRNRKGYYLCFVFTTIVTTSYLFFGGKYPNDNSSGIIPESASLSIKQKKVDQTITKDTKDMMKQEENINSMENDTEGRIIRFYTSNIEGGNRGSFTILTHPEWAPIGMKQFDALTDSSFWKGCRFFRVIDKFIAQFGIHGNPSVQEFWDGNVIKDDEVRKTNTRGTISFATSGKDTRGTQLFINTGEENMFLDAEGFAPIAEVIDGMDVVDRLYSGYGEPKPDGDGPVQWEIEEKGNDYLKKNYPKLSYISEVIIQ